MAGETKKINWKEMLTRTVTPLVGYSAFGGAVALALLIGILVICL